MKEYGGHGGKAQHIVDWTSVTNILAAAKHGLCDIRTRKSQVSTPLIPKPVVGTREVVPGNPRSFQANFQPGGTPKTLLFRDAGVTQFTDRLNDILDPCRTRGWH